MKKIIPITLVILCLFLSGCSKLSLDKATEFSAKEINNYNNYIKSCGIVYNDGEIYLLSNSNISLHSILGGYDILNVNNNGTSNINNKIAGEYSGLFCDKGKVYLNSGEKIYTVPAFEEDKSFSNIPKLYNSDYLETFYCFDGKLFCWEDEELFYMEENGTKHYVRAEKSEYMEVEYIAFNDNNLYIESDHKIYKIDVSNPLHMKYKKLADIYGDVYEFIVNDNYIYYAFEKSERMYIMRCNTESGKLEKVTDFLTEKEGYTLSMNGYGDKAFILTDEGNLYSVESIGNIKYMGNTSANELFIFDDEWIYLETYGSGFMRVSQTEKKVERVY